MDKQLNARIKPDLHSQIKQLSSDSKIIINTLVETLLEIGLKHYRESNLAIDTTSYITKDDLITFESGLLKKVESLIASASGQAKSIDGSSVKPSPVEYAEVKNIPSPDTHSVDTELTTKEMLEYLGININSKNPKRDIDRGLKSYPDEVWQPIARGYWKRIS